MATNIEIKARIADWEAVRQRAEALCGASGQLIPQEDTFFPTEQGRLKLRQLAEKEGQLIYYERGDISGPKRSDYLTAPTSDPSALKAILAAALGVRGVVRKQRLLFLRDNTRIHLDQVEGLGCFLELEVMLGPNQSEAEGEATARHLLAELGVPQADLVDVAYMDLLEQGDASVRPAGSTAAEPPRP